jgi:hypothetical protein
MDGGMEGVEPMGIHGCGGLIHQKPALLAVSPSRFAFYAELSTFASALSCTRLHRVAGIYLCPTRWCAWLFAFMEVAAKAKPRTELELPSVIQVPRIFLASALLPDRLKANRSIESPS